MRIQTLNGRILGEQTGPVRVVGVKQGVVLEEVTRAEEEEETLVVDPRGNRRPSQIVEQRLTVLLATSRPKWFLDADSSLCDVRMVRRGGGALFLQGGRRPRRNEFGNGGEQMNRPRPKVETTGDVTIITFTGDASRGIENRIAAELEGRTGVLKEVHVLLDFTNVERINSEEMGTLIGLHQKVRAAGGRLTLFNLDADIYEAFTVTHLQTLLRICREDSPALAAVQGS